MNINGTIDKYQFLKSFIHVKGKVTAYESVKYVTRHEKIGLMCMQNLTTSLDFKFE